METADEHKKEAVNIGVTLSTQLISASLVMITVLGGFATFIIDKSDVGLLFYLLIGISFLAFIVSIFSGGKGIDTARKKGFSGDWNLEDTKSTFNLQAMLCGLGLLFFILSIFIGNICKEKSETQLDILSKTEKDIYGIQLIDSLRQVEMKHLNEEIKILNRKLEEMKSSINKMELQKTVPNSTKVITKPTI